MRNARLWEPTKFQATQTRLRASRTPGHVAARSWMVADLLARVYSEALEKHARGRLADLGCGEAPLFEVYRRRVEDSICLDRLPRSSRALRHIDLVGDLNRGIPLRTGTIDTLLATDVLEHLEKPHTLWNEAVRILRPGGRIIVGVPFLYRIHEAPHDYFRYTRHQLEKLCADRGFRVLSLEPYGGPLAVLLDLVGKNLPGKALARIYQQLASFVLNSSLGRRLDLRNRELFPLGYCLVAEKQRGEPAVSTWC